MGGSAGSSRVALVALVLQLNCSVCEQIIDKVELLCNPHSVSSQTLHHSYSFVFRDSDAVECL